MKVHAIIPSGGRGSRTSYSIPKQYLKFWDKEMIAYTINIFQHSNKIDSITIPAEEEFIKLLQDIKNKYHFSKLKSIIVGGATRQQSVFHALKNIDASQNDLIAVHDAARPLLPPNILEDALNQAIKFDNVVVAIKANDTLAMLGNEDLEYLNREKIYYVQTPQIFRFGILKKAFEECLKNNFLATDESMMVNFINEKIHFVNGSIFNFKVTTDLDIKLFSKLSENLFDSINQIL